LYDDIGFGLTTWSPLASGLLTGKYNDGIPTGSRAALKGYEWLAESIVDPAKIAKVRQLIPIARDLDCTLAQLALAWCIKNPRVSTVITGATRPEQVIENMKAQDVAPRLTAEVLSRIDAVVGSGVRSASVHEQSARKLNRRATLSLPLSRMRGRRGGD